MFVLVLLLSIRTVQFTLLVKSKTDKDVLVSETANVTDRLNEIDNVKAFDWKKKKSK